MKNSVPLLNLCLAAAFAPMADARAAADLVITSLSPVPATISQGVSTRFDITVKNQGSSSTAADWLGVTVHSAGVYATFGGKNVSLAAGASTNIRTESWMATAPTYPIRATADYVNYYPEANESNNTFTVDTPLAVGVDLVTTNVRVLRPDVIAGDLVLFEVTVRNQGTVALPPTWFAVSVNVNGGFAAWGGGTFGLAPGGSVIIRTNGWIATAGSFSMEGEVDYSHTISETLENNNRGSYNFTSPAPVYQSSAAAGGWTLRWSDEFTGSGAPDASKWTQEVGFQRNNELQYFTVNRPENLRRENGVLIIEARREDYSIEGKPNSYGAKVAPYTSASLITKGKASWLYGRIDIAAKLATARGTWSALWTLGDNISIVGWPRCGEIDIVESVGWETAITHHSIHTQARSHLTRNGYSVPSGLPGLGSSFMRYSIEWDAQRIRFFTNGRMIANYPKEGSSEDVWPFSRSQYLLLNLAVGGSWGGVSGIDATAFPQRMQIDYVRVYQK